MVKIRLNKEILKRKFCEAIVKNFNYIALVIEDKSNNYEVRIIKHESFAEKFQYYIEKYNEELVYVKEDKKIITIVYGNDFSKLENELNIYIDL